jgi:hypothetical protein
MTFVGPELATGLFTLGGVIVGAVASTGSQVYLDRKREEREADRAKQLVVGELLHLQLVLSSASQGMGWPPIDDVGAFLPNSAWQEHRSRLADVVDEDLWDKLVMAYALLEIDRMRFATAAKLAPDRTLTDSEAASLRQTAYHLGRLRRRLGDGGGGWPDEIFEEHSESFMQWVDGLSADDLENEAVIVQAKQWAHELAELKRDGGDAWLAAINRRLERGNPDQQ